MKSVQQQLDRCVRDAMSKIGVEGDPILRRSQDEKFGDFQSNAAMGLAKKLGKKPRDVAAEIIEALDVDSMCETPEIAGPGFINFRLKPEFVAQSLQLIPSANANSDEDRLGIEQVAQRETVVVDLSSPNLAKEMHVGHLRSTVIGDCICRVLEFQGHDVHRENHVGDWGTQFGMLVAFLRATQPEVMDQPDELAIADLESFYVQAKTRFDADDDFKTESRETVVKLQKGDEATRKIWKAFCDESLRHCHAIYDRLNVRLEDRGESYYTELMEKIVERVEAMIESRDDGLVSISDGALCIFMDRFKTRDSETLPVIVRKSDGGFNYATSDLATIVHRVDQLKATRIIYVVGLAQKQHFEMVFEAVRQLGWVGENVSLQHIGFGNMLAASGRPFKTREGGTVKLKDLLDEAVARSRAVLDDQKSEERAMSDDQAANVAEVVGLAAVKYYDLSHALQSDYKFNLDHMLAMEGNTAPYMLYAYARIRSINRKAGVDVAEVSTDQSFILEHPMEIALGKKLLQFTDILEVVGRDLAPHVLTEYLYDLAKTFSRFYDKKIGVRVIDASPESVRDSRLRLCDLAARTLKLGLSLLGIETVEQM